MNDEVASITARSFTKISMSSPCMTTCRNFSAPSPHSCGVAAMSVSGDPERASLTSIAAPVTRTYRYPSPDRRRHSPPCLAEPFLVNQQPKETSGEPKSMVAARAPAWDPAVRTPAPEGAISKASPCSVHENSAPGSGTLEASRAPGLPVSESNGYAALTQTLRPGTRLPERGEAPLGGLYLWVSFLSSRSSRADSMYPDARSRKCSRVRPSTSGVTSSSGSENAPSSFQSMHTSHLACMVVRSLSCSGLDVDSTPDVLDDQALDLPGEQPHAAFVVEEYHSAVEIDSDLHVRCAS